MPDRLVLLTGFPGFIGRRLVSRLLAADPEVRIVALVEREARGAATEAAGEIDGGRIEILVGDIAERRLGLSDEDYERLRAETTDAYHLAALYNLAVPIEVAQRVNVEGTGNVLELCAGCERLERLNYVSTAYVAGLRRGVVYEHELSLGQRFGNHYESTKFQAELWVQGAMNRVPVTVYRPAIVVGDSRSGETRKFDGPYYMLRVIARSVRAGVPIPQFGRSGAPFNVVPVDFVVDALAACGTDPGSVGETLHLVDPDPITAAELLALLAHEYADKELGPRVPAGIVAESLRLKVVRDLFAGAPRESIRYLNHPVRFDTRRAEKVLGPLGLRCPPVREYVEPMVSFFRAHEHDPALRPANTL